MFVQISRDYNCLPSLDTITCGQIRWYYGMLRHELKEHTKPKEGA